MKEIVRKDYRLVNAGYKLTLPEIRLILIIISKLEKDKYSYVFDIKDFPFIANNYNHKILNNIKHSILRKPIRIIEKDGGQIDCNWFAGFYYKDGKIECTIYHRLIPYLFNLKERFVMYELENILKLKSVYSIRIYELLKEYEGLKEREFEIEQLYSILNVPKTYKMYFIFKSKVLKQAIEDINKNTDLLVDFREKRVGRQVYKIVFDIKSQNKNKDENNNNEDMMSYFIQDIDNILTDKYLDCKDEVLDIIRKNIDLDKEIILSNLLLSIESQPENLPAFFTSALKKDFAKKIREKAKLLEEEEMRKKEEKQRKIKEEEERVKSIEEERERLIAMFNDLPDEIQKEYIEKAKSKYIKSNNPISLIIFAAGLYVEENIKNIQE